ncbi:glutathione S-transferase [Thiobacillus sp.]|uniref:glutathione S-transferase n=1 Tax=Thiobacillus sp. TaxID=924 RepID=UPI0025D014DC|nr:glutathione S-transferase [Thiobacillus sp.]MBT9540774.1 glutathione S-transferase [Thiobacillus sp.]
MNPSLPVLYSFRRCPYAIRARLALKHAGLAIALREVALKYKPAALLEISPKATVPVLQLVDGSVLEESLDIMHWALDRFEPTQPDHARWRTGCADELALIALNDGAFKRLLDGYKYADQTQVAARCRDEAFELFIAPLERRLCVTRYLLGESPSLADMAILPFIRQFAGVDADGFAAAPFPTLRHWLDGLTRAPLFVSVMPKHAPWQPGDPLTLL